MMQDSGKNALRYPLSWDVPFIPESGCMQNAPLAPLLSKRVEGDFLYMPPLVG